MRGISFASYVAVVVVASCLSVLPGCKEEGSAEKIGKQIDEGAQKAKEKAEGAGKRVEKAVDDLTK
jgi:hyperosmotically inducible protein